jgi:hypothetical protein
MEGNFWALGTILWEGDYWKKGDGILFLDGL